MIQNKAQSFKNSAVITQYHPKPKPKSFTNKKIPKVSNPFFSRQILQNLNPFLNENHHSITPFVEFFRRKDATLRGATRSEVVQKAVEVPKHPSDRPGFGDVSIGGAFFFGDRNDSPPNDPNKNTTRISQTSPFRSITRPSHSIGPCQHPTF